LDVPQAIDPQPVERIATGGFVERIDQPGPQASFGSGLQDRFGLWAPRPLVIGIRDRDQFNALRQPPAQLRPHGC